MHFIGPLYCSQLFDCLLIQVSKQPIRWQQLSALRHVDTVKRSCWSSSWASEWGRKVALNVAWLVPNGLVWVLQKQLIYWDLHLEPSAGFTENGLINRKSGRSVGEDAMLMQEVRGGWSDWFRMTERQQSLIKPIGTTKVHRRASTFWTLKQQGYSWRPPVRLLSARNRKKIAIAHHRCAADNSAATGWCCHANMDHHLIESVPQRIKAVLKTEVGPAQY